MRGWSPEEDELLLQLIDVRARRRPCLFEYSARTYRISTVSHARLPVLSFSPLSSV